MENREIVKIAKRSQEVLYYQQKFSTEAKSHRIPRGSLDCHRAEAAGPAGCFAGPAMHRMEERRTVSVRGPGNPLRDPQNDAPGKARAEDEIVAL